MVCWVRMYPPWFSPASGENNERLLTRDAGLEGRPWYKHFIYAPGFYTGYGVKTIPAVREAIEQREYAKVDPQIEIAADVLNLMAERIERLTLMISKETVLHLFGRSDPVVALSQKGRGGFQIEAGFD